ncbi:MAG: sulfate adenylyltransferase [Streptosporangiaceae bacterium]
MSGITTPHGGRLVGLLVDSDRAAKLKRRAAVWPSWNLTRRQLCDLELLACGGFSPLRSFLGRDDYLAVCESQRLANGTLWPIPVILDVPDEMAAIARSAGTLALRDADGVLLAALHISETWRPDLRAEARAVFGTTDLAHAGVAHLLQRNYPCYITGALEVVQLPRHPDFRPLRRTPAEVRAEFTRRGWSRVIAFQTRNPMHRAHQELTLRAILQENANLLIHPVVGVTKPGDIDPCTRVRCYRAILPSYPEGRVMLSLLPLAMRMGGPREALWHAIIRKNYGATHFIVGRDHAGPGANSDGQQFYRAYDAQELLRQHAPELGMRILSFKRMVYVENSGAYVQADEAPPGSRVRSISGTQLKLWLRDGRELPPWYTSPEVAAELRRSYPPRSE